MNLLYWIYEFKKYWTSHIITHILCLKLKMAYNWAICHLHKIRKDVNFVCLFYYRCYRNSKTRDCEIIPNLTLVSSMYHVIQCNKLNDEFQDHRFGTLYSFSFAQAELVTVISVRNHNTESVLRKTRRKPQCVSAIAISINTMRWTRH